MRFPMSVSTSVSTSLLASVLTKRARGVAVGLAVCATLAGSSEARGDDTAARSQGPFIMVTSDTPEPDPLPLKATRGDVHIAGVIAHVRITQVYRNEGTRPLEAIYVFPGSTRAAVFGMRMKIGDRAIEAAIEKREAARKIYERAKREGKTASLLEQERPNVFQMNVANILPGDEVRVELDYTELIVPDESVYEFVYPAVVGPRYSGEQGKSETWHKNPHVKEGEPEPYRFGVNVEISAGMGIQSLASPSHAVQPSFRGPGKAELSVAGKGAGNRDFVLRYRLRGNAIETGLLRFEGDKEKFFLMMIQPPKRIARDQMPPREYVFIVDVSGSMRGFPLDVSKKLMRDLLRGLRPVDRFNILFFAGGSYQLSAASIPASSDNINRALRVLGERRGGGGTNLLAALRRALAMPHSRGTSRTFVALTDGYVTVEAEAFRLVREKLGEANFFAFGIGSSVNRHLIEGLARAGMGEPFVVLDQSQAGQESRRFGRMVSTPALTDIKVSFSGLDAYDVEPLAVPDLLAERPLVIFGKYRGDGDGTISVRGSSGAGPYNKTLRATSFAPRKEHSALRYLWARHRVRTLQDRQQLLAEDLKEEITEIGLRYNLMTDYTSFVAVDKVSRSNGNPDTVKQPLPLPKGVSGSAVGDGYRAAVRPAPRKPQVAMPTPPRSLEEHEDSDDDADYGESIVVTGGSMIALQRAGNGYASDARSSALSVATARRVSLGQRVDVETRNNESVVSMPTLLRVGITNNLEARVASNLISFRDGELARPDLTLGTKLNLWDRTDVLGIGVFGDVTLDFDNDSARELEARLLLLAERSLSPRLALRANLGLGLLRLADSDELDRSFLYAAELAYRIGTRWLTFAGTAGALAEESALSVEAGIGHQLTRNLLLGLSAKAGLSDAESDLAGGFYLRWSL